MIEILLDLGAIGFFYLITGILYLYPTIISFKNAKQIDSNEYFKLSLLFLIGSILWVFVSFLTSKNNILTDRNISFEDPDYPYRLIGLANIMYWSWLYLLGNHAITLRWGKNVVLSRILIIVGSIFIIDEILFIFFFNQIGYIRIEPHPYAIYFRGPLSTIYEGMIALTLLYAYYSVELIVKSRRTVIVRLWWIMAAGFRIGLTTVFLFVNYLNLSNTLVDIETLKQIFLFRQIFQLGFAFQIFLISVTFSEMLLLSEHQLLRAKILYEGHSVYKLKQKITNTQLSNYLEYLRENEIIK